MGARETLRRLLLRNWAFGAPCWKVKRTQHGCSVGGRVVLRPLLALSSMSSSYLNMGIIIQAFLYFLFPSFLSVHFVYIYILCVRRVQANSLWVSPYQSFLILSPFLFFCVRLVYIYILCVSNVEAISLWVFIGAFSIFYFSLSFCVHFVYIYILYQVFKISHYRYLLNLSYSFYLPLNPLCAFCVHLRVLCIKSLISLLTWCRIPYGYSPVLFCHPETLE